MEMCSGNYVVAMTSILDSEEGFERFSFALKEIDQKYIGKKPDYEEDNYDFVKKIYISNKKAMEIHQAEEKEHIEVKLDDSVGKISKDYVFLYPPGIPILVPGEIISSEVVSNIKRCIDLKLNLCGLPHSDGIEVVITK